MTKEQVAKRDCRWVDVEEKPTQVTKTIDAKLLPASIVDIPDDVVNWAITCEVTKRPFRIIKQELAFYRRMELPLPHVHPDERHRRRAVLRNPPKLWSRQCAKCKKGIETSYSPERPETVYCENCYLETVY